MLQNATSTSTTPTSTKCTRNGAGSSAASRTTEQLLNAKDLTPEKKKLVAAVKREREQVYHERVVGGQKRRTRSLWLWRMALRKTNEDASVAAQLIDDASLISHVANDPDVQVAREAASDKVPAKTHKYLCNASHLPSDLNSAHPPFPFTCPICAKRFATEDDCDDEEEFVGHAAKEFRKSHDQFHKRAPVFPLEPDDIIPCTFHYTLLPA